MPPSLNLQLERAELAQALKSINRLVKAGGKAEAVLTFKEGILKIELPGMSLGVAATGEWSGRARISASFLQVLARALPYTGPVSLIVAGERLDVNGVSTGCRWEADAGSYIALPLNAPFTMILSLAYHYTLEHIGKSGLKALVGDAEKRRDALIGKALSALSEFGITEIELRALVDEKMKGFPRP